MTNSLNGTTDQNEASWRNEYLRNEIFKNIVTVDFIKKDGTQRKLRCTLRPDLLPPQTDLEEAVSKLPFPTSLAVWDLDNAGWRSFRYDSIVGFTIEPDEDRSWAIEVVT
jgi:hypothetical protein